MYQDSTNRHVPSKDCLVNNREQLEVRLEDWIGPRVPPLRKCIDSIEQGTQHLLYLDLLRRCPQRVITAEHLTETFAACIMCPTHS